MITLIIVRQTQIKKFEKQKKKGVLILCLRIKLIVPEAREAMDRFKMEAAAEVGVQS